ncbi:hypothetical protein BGZ65_001311, partial [Modicella reniformis]
FVSAGVRQVTERLSMNIGTVHYNTTIDDIVIVDDTTGVNGNLDGSIVLVDSHGVQRAFDHVIFATQANQAAATLAGHKDNHPLPKPFLADCEEGYKECDYGCIEEHNHIESEMPRSLTIESLKPSHPFYQQIKTLLKFPYERIRAVCHTDTSFLPKNPAHWRLLNIAKSSSADVLACPLNMISKELDQEMELRSRKARSPTSSVFSLRSSSSLTAATTAMPSHSTMAVNSHNSAMATHFMNGTSSTFGSTTKYLQTTNPLYPPRPETVISSAWFERAIVNPASMRVVDELDLLMEQQTTRWIDRNSGLAVHGQKEDEQGWTSMSASDRVWFVGSYAYPGIPLLEGSVASAAQVVDRILAAEPSHRLAPSVEASEDSFLKQSMPGWRRRAALLGQERQRDITNGGRLNHSRATMNSMYFQAAWKHPLQGPTGNSAHVESWRSSVYVEMAWMLVLYLVAIAKWFLVMVVESFGGDGSRWASV